MNSIKGISRLSLKGFCRRVFLPLTVLLLVVALFSSSFVSIAWGQGSVKYPITYDMRWGGTNPPTNPSEYDSSVDTPIADAYKSGYKFKGWAARYADGTESGAQKSFVIPAGTHGAIELAAIYDTNIQGSPITYELDGGTNHPSNRDWYFEDNEYFPINIAVPHKTGYIFKGWTAVYSDGRPAITDPMLSFSILAGTTGEITLTAHWTPQQVEYTVHYYHAGTTSTVAPSKTASGLMGTLVTENAVNIAGYAALSPTIVTAKLNATNNVIVFYYNYDFSVRYMLTYDGNGATGGTVPVDSHSPYASSSIVLVLGQGSLTKTGFDFLGWAQSYDAAKATYVAGSTFSIQKDTVLYAVWEENIPEQLTVTYNPGEHGTFQPVTHRVNYGDATPAAPGITDVAGWKFTGWLPKVSATVTANTVYVAQWEQITFTVEFKDWDGRSLKTETVAYGGSATAPLQNPTRSGYTFTGWDRTFTNVMSDLVVTAQYRADDTSSSSSSSSKSVSNKAPVAVLPSPSPPNNELPINPVPHEDDVDEPLPTWALVNLVLSVGGIILAILLIAYALLQRNQVQYKKICLITALALGIVGLIVFLFTEDMSLSMGLLDKWTIVNVILFIGLIIAVATALHYKEDEPQEPIASPTNKPASRPSETRNYVT